MILEIGIKVLESVIGTVSKLGTTALMKKAGKTIWDRFKKEPESTENKELLRITRIAYLRASLAACRHLLKHGYDEKLIEGNAREVLRDLNNYLANEIKEARNGDWFRSARFVETFEALVKTSETDQAELLRHSLKDLLIGEIQLAKIFPVDAYQDIIAHGWQDSGKQMDWLELMASSLPEELAKNKVAQTTLQLKIWDDLNQKMEGFNTDWKQFKDYLDKLSEQYQIFWQKLEDMQSDMHFRFDATDQKLEDITETLKKEKGRIDRKHLGLKPARSEFFQGRDKELKELHESLFSDDHFILLVNGQGGVGKTTLASEYYYKYEQEYIKLGWVQSGKSITEALLTLIRGLELSFDPKATEQEKLDAVLYELGNLKKPCLLVIDNANKIKDLHTHYRHLAGLTNIHLLITTRVTEFRNAKMYAIDGLPEDDAWILFKEHYPEISEEERPIVLSIHEAVYANTLVMELLAKNLNELNRLEQQYTLNGLLDDLRKKGILKISQSREVGLNYQHFVEAKPEEVIAAMYDLAELSPNEKVILSCVAILPTEPVPYPYLKLIFESIENYDKILTDLNQKGWIEYIKEDNSFKWSPVIQEIVRFKNQDLVQDSHLIIDSLATMLNREIIHLDNYKHTTLFTRYAETALGHLVEVTSATALLWQNTGIFYSNTGDLTKAMEAFEQMKIAYSEVWNKNIEDSDAKNGLAVSFSKLGETHSALGNLDQALKFFEKFSSLMEELHEDYPNNVSFKNGLAISYSKLGQTHSALGNLDQALKFFEQRSELGEQLFKDYPNNVSFKNGLAVSYTQLGRIKQRQTGKKSAACKDFIKAKVLLTELVEQAKGYAEYRYNLDWVNAQLEECGCDES